jgi:hypothetical protein
MAFTAKDGRKFGNRQQMAAYNERSTTKATHEEPDGDEGEAEGEDVSEQPIGEVVAEHGPAHKIVIHHDHEGGKHRVHSHHGGKVHKSEHESADAAHMHAAHAAGLNAEEEPDGDEPIGAAEPAGIPGM